MNQLVSLVDLSITGNGKTKGLPILIQELNTSQKDYVTLPGNYAPGAVHDCVKGYRRPSGHGQRPNVRTRNQIF